MLFIIFSVVFVFHCDVGNDNDDDGNGADLLTYVECSNTSVDSTAYYVSSAGNDSNNGTSQTTPFKTISASQTVAVQLHLF